jgi:hypothetical protein
MEILTDRDVESASSAWEHEGLCFSCVKDFANKILATKSLFIWLVVICFKRKVLLTSDRFVPRESTGGWWLISHTNRA